MPRIVTLLFAVFLALPLPAPAADRPLLSIHTNTGTVELTRADLEAFPQTEFVTETPYTRGMTRFRGPSMTRLLDRYGLTGKIRLKALNDYVVETEAARLKQLDPILALRLNDRPMSVRDKGPIWIMVPLSDRPELDVPDTHRLLVWQLSDIAAD